MDGLSLWSRMSGLIGAMLVLVILACGAGWDAYAQTMTQRDEASGARAGSFQLAQYYYFPNYPYPQVKRKQYRPRRHVRPGCAFPWTYSQGLRRCICVKEGYSVSGGKCVKTAEICQENAHWSREDNACVCDEGFSRNGPNCVDPNRGVVTYRPGGDGQCLWPRVKSDDGEGCVCSSGYAEQSGKCVRAETVTPDARQRAGRNQLLTQNISLVQACLKEAGYLRSEVTSTMDRPAWTAFWFFKQDYSVGRTPKGVHDPVAQHKLFTLCRETARQLALLPALEEEHKTPEQEVRYTGPAMPAPPAGGEMTAGADDGSTGEGARSAQPASTPEKVYAKPEANCLPGDLYQLIVEAYGPRPGLKQCVQTCIAKPAGKSDKELAEFARKRGVRWCESCIEIGTPLPLQDVLKIERGAGVQVCTRPPERLPKWVNASRTSRPAYTRVRGLYAALPRNTSNRDSIAVVIGNSAYGTGLPGSVSAARSADAFHALLSEHLGFEQENIIDLRQADRKQLESVFGKAGNHSGKLANRLEDNPETTVFIYYAGHAFTRADGNESYLLPADTVKYREERSGYPLSQLYANLQGMGAKSILMMVEADFGRDLSDYVFAPNIPEMQVSALPAAPVPGLTVMTATDGDQRNLDDPELGIGMFTRYLIEGLAGRADLAPIGNEDGRIDTVELYAYTSRMVRLTARKSFGLLQKPMMSRSGNLRVSQVQKAGH